MTPLLFACNLLEAKGTKLSLPHVEPLGDKLFQLRIQCAGNITRIIYFAAKGRTFVLLHGFVKKTQKTPDREKEIAKVCMQDYLRRHGK